jgi:hypothetical protein
MKFIERINGYWLQEVAIQFQKDGKDGRKVLTDAMPDLSHELIDKLLEKKALLKGNSIDGFEVDEAWPSNRD